MRTFADVIERWPSAETLAEDLQGQGLRVSGIGARHWKRRGIPGRYWLAVAKAAEDRNLGGVTVDLLARLAATEGPVAPADAEAAGETRAAAAFDTILVANRGEIAVRVIRTARALGYRTVAVHSEADARAPHVALADRAVAVGPPPVAESYLDADAILAAAARAGAGAVHPGYGFLAENADFAQACVERGLVFIGPPPEAIRVMGNKRLAKGRVESAGVPSVPGYHGAEQSDAALAREAARIGYPLMVKAAAGGGGRGLRPVAAKRELKAALAAARSEALGAFGSDELILERRLADPRHVEIQVFADRHGNLVHLGERDCSVQRRHQKVVEEAPSPALTPELRARMGETAIAAARSVGYAGAGTVEFLLEPDGGFYFLEMNTRIQVEHPVTEMITGQDLVAWQIKVAAGERLPLAQDEIALSGHAIEARLYAEEPAAGFLPRSGRVAAWRPGAGAGVRVDHALAEGLDITPHYDPIVAKIIAHGATREEARRRLLRAIEDTVFLGVECNRAFLIDVLRHDAFVRGEATTGFVERHFPPEALAASEPDAATAALAAALLYERSAGAGPGWRSASPAAVPMDIRAGDDSFRVVVTPGRERRYAVLVEDAAEPVELVILDDSGGRLSFIGDGLRQRAAFAFAGEALHLDLGGRTARFAEAAPAGAAAGPEADGRLLAPMSGRVVAVRAADGAAVRKGDIVVVLEAMKMEHEVRAPADGTVKGVAVAAGDQVDARQLLAVVEPEGGPGH